MTGQDVVMVIRCQCYPPVSRELGARADRDQWEQLLLKACRRRGCTCVRHETSREPVR